MNLLKQLSTRYLKTAKQLSSTWMNLVKKSTKHTVIYNVLSDSMHYNLIE